eukprot:gene7508-7022_t
MAVRGSLVEVDLGLGVAAHAADVHFCGKVVAFGCSDHSVKVRPLHKDSAEPEADLRQHTAAVVQVKWARPGDGMVLASCSTDVAIIWAKDANGQWQAVYEHANPTLSIAWAPHHLGLILACGSLDGSIALLTQAGQQWAQTRIPAHSTPVLGLCWGPPIPSSAMFGVLQGQQHADL